MKTNNPFVSIVNMFTLAPVLVTNKLLDEVRGFMPKNSVPRYDDVFSVLQYLAEKNALALEEALGVYKVWNPHYKENHGK